MNNTKPAAELTHRAVVKDGAIMGIGKTDGDAFANAKNLYGGAGLSARGLRYVTATRAADAAWDEGDCDLVDFAKDGTVRHAEECQD